MKYYSCFTICVLFTLFELAVSLQGIKVRFGRQESFACLAGFGGFTPSPVSSQAKDDGAGTGKGFNVDNKCPCGSNIEYGICCRPYHTKELQAHDVISLVKSRYSAYSLEKIDYIIDSTSVGSPDYLAYFESPNAVRNSRRNWTKDIRKNMIDPYFYVRMEVDDVVYPSADDSQAVVVYRHLAIQKKDNIMYPIEEKATCVKVNGVWKYERGEVQRPDPELSQKMMIEWPPMMGLNMKIRDESNSLEQ